MNRAQRRKLTKDLIPCREHYKKLRYETQEMIDDGYPPEVAVKHNQSIWTIYAKRHNAKENITPVSERFFYNRIYKDLEIEAETETKSLSFFGKVADFIANRGRLLMGAMKIKTEFE